MPTSNRWKKFFDGHAPQYMEEVFTRDTVAEVDFLVNELGFSPGSSVLDIGCGTGRHAIELAKRGFVMTGVDISEGMLGQARSAATEAGVAVSWVRADASDELPSGPYDAALCLCEGAFGLLGESDDPYEHEARILGNIAASLRAGVPFVLTACNGFALARGATDEDVRAGRFDPDTFTESYELNYEQAGETVTIKLQERGFVPSELVLMLQGAGFDVEHIWGGTAGNWGKRKLDLDEVEIMMVARKR